MPPQKTILHIEDNFENRVLVRRLLQSADYQVLEAENALQAINHLRRVRPDLILMDINMDVEVTLNRLVNLIKERFNFYHASIFLLDPLGKFATLRESTGEAGAQLKATGHKLAVGSPSIVGQATGKGQPVVIGDVTQEANYYANPLLPDTRSEMAIPMKIGEQVLGALDVQSTAFNAFSQEDINVLQILANQTAIAIQNEDLFSHTHGRAHRPA